jgi:hypothetical protein
MRNSSSDSSLDAKYSFTTHQHVRRNLKHQFTTNAADVEKVVPEVLSAQSKNLPVENVLHLRHASFIAVGGTTQRNSHKQDLKWMPSQAY